MDYEIQVRPDIVVDFLMLFESISISFELRLLGLTVYRSKEQIKHLFLTS